MIPGVQPASTPRCSVCGFLMRAAYADTRACGAIPDDGSYPNWRRWLCKRGHMAELVEVQPEQWLLFLSVMRQQFEDAGDRVAFGPRTPDEKRKR